MYTRHTKHILYYLRFTCILNILNMDSPRSSKGAPSGGGPLAPPGGTAGDMPRPAPGPSQARGYGAIRRSLCVRPRIKRNVVKHKIYCI